MTKRLVINISLLLKGLESRMSMFIFPEEVTPWLWNRTLKEMMQGIVYAAKNEDEIPFPSLDLVQLYEIEGAYQISFFCRALGNFQRDISYQLVCQNLLDEIVQGNYIEASIVKNHLVLVSTDSNKIQIRGNDCEGFINDHARGSISFESPKLSGALADW